VNPRIAITLLALSALGASSPAANSETPQKAARKKISTPTISCGRVASLTLNASSATQGGLILAKLLAKTSLADVHAKWGPEEVSFWPVEATGPSKLGIERWYAFVPVDLEKVPGDYPLTVEVHSNAGPPTTCQLTIRVTPGKFATESLHVDKQFVEPNPEQVERAKKEQQQLREIYAHVTPERLWHGRFRIPLDRVTTGANFGRRRVLNGQPGSPHTGVDFPAATGTPVYAAQAGHVVLAQALFFPGNIVVIDHGLGVYTLYGHLSEISVKVGDELSSGAILGKVGATGRVTGPHLHWGLTVNHARVNALQIVHLQGL
jgi:hypothetical protein